MNKIEQRLEISKARKKGFGDAVVMFFIVFILVIIFANARQNWDNDNHWEIEAGQMYSYFDGYSDMTIFENGSFVGCFIGADCEVEK